MLFRGDGLIILDYEEGPSSFLSGSTLKFNPYTLFFNHFIVYTLDLVKIFSPNILFILNYLCQGIVW